MSNTEQESAVSSVKDVQPFTYDEDSEPIMRNLGPNWRPARPARPAYSIVMNGTPPLMAQTQGVNASNLPEGRYPLSGISIRAFTLGISFGASLTITSLLVYLSYQLWRVPFFLVALSLFHFLEFYITARYSTRDATVKAFLLSSNGWTYHAAHGSAILECLASNYFAPTTYSQWTSTFTNNKYLTSLGLVLVVIGQIIRTLAMAQAGSNFNHIVQVHQREDHELVTSGIYRFLRHPSYFGFFWWGLGTQLVLQNAVSFWIYAFVLSSFFANRINRECLSLSFQT